MQLSQLPLRCVSLYFLLNYLPSFVENSESPLYHTYKSRYISTHLKYLPYMPALVCIYPPSLQDPISPHAKPRSSKLCSTQTDKLLYLTWSCISLSRYNSKVPEYREKMDSCSSTLHEVFFLIFSLMVQMIIRPKSSYPFVIHSPTSV